MVSKETKDSKKLGLSPATQMSSAGGSRNIGNTASTNTSRATDSNPSGTSRPPALAVKYTTNQLSPKPFPDKKIDRQTPKRGRLGTPRERIDGGFRRRISLGSSSGEDSPRLQRGPKAPRVLTPDGKSRFIKCLVQPRAVRSIMAVGGSRTNVGTTPSSEKPHNMSIKQVLREVSKDFSDEGRPPSPRPQNHLQSCVEHSKQMLVWDEWVNGNGTDYDIASISYKRVESQNILATMPKALKPPTPEDLEGDETE